MLYVGHYLVKCDVLTLVSDIPLYINDLYNYYHYMLWYMMLCCVVLHCVLQFSVSTHTPAHTHMPFNPIHCVEYSWDHLQHAVSALS